MCDSIEDKQRSKRDTLIRGKLAFILGSVANAAVIILLYCIHHDDTPRHLFAEQCLVGIGVIVFGSFFIVLPLATFCLFFENNKARGVTGLILSLSPFPVCYILELVINAISRLK